MIDATTKLMVVSSDIPTTDKRSARFQNETEFVTVGELLGVVGWKNYKAFITQTGTGVPVVEVLNANEADYLGDITWAFDTDHIDGTLQSGSFSAFTVPKPVLLDTAWVVPTISGNTGVIIAGSDFAKTYLEIAMKEAGVAPLLLSAACNGCGTAITLSFDKAMSAQGLYAAFVTGSDIAFSGGAGGGSPSAVTVSGNNIICTFDGRYVLTGDTITVTIAANKVISTDYGRYAGVTGGAVTNVITAANPTLASAVVPADGKSIICTFSKAMTPPECATGITYTIGATPKTVGRVDRGSLSTILVLTDLETIIKTGDTVTVERAAADIVACGVLSTDGGCLNTITAGAVTNNSEVPV